MKIQRALFVTTKEYAAIKYALECMIDGSVPTEPKEKEMYELAKAMLKEWRDDK